MNSRKKLIKNVKQKTIWLITLLMFVTLYLFDNGSWGNYLFGVCAIAIFALGVVLGNRTTVIAVRPFYFYQK